MGSQEKTGSHVQKNTEHLDVYSVAYDNFLVLKEKYGEGVSFTSTLEDLEISSSEWIQLCQRITEVPSDAKDLSERYSWLGDKRCERFVLGVCRLASLGLKVEGGESLDMEKAEELMLKAFVHDESLPLVNRPDVGLGPSKRRPEGEFNGSNDNGVSALEEQV